MARRPSATDVPPADRSLPFRQLRREGDEEEAARLLTRFGHLVYMFFMITPPIATVERAWKRGRQVGRYKAVDDLLAHNVEAYKGMPRRSSPGRLSGTSRSTTSSSTTAWRRASSRAPSRSAGTTRLTSSTSDACSMSNATVRSRPPRRARKRSIPIPPPWQPSTTPPSCCAAGALLREITLADHRTGRIYARNSRRGRSKGLNSEALAAAMQDDDARVALLALAPGDPRGPEPGVSRSSSAAANRPIPSADGAAPKG